MRARDWWKTAVWNGNADRRLADEPVRHYALRARV